MRPLTSVGRSSSHSAHPLLSRTIGDGLGGLAAMLVAFPSAIAFGLVVYAPLGPASAPAGAMAGMIGAAALGLIAPLLGGTPRLITAPCAPAAAVLAAFLADAINGTQQIDSKILPLLLMGVGLLTGVIQIIIGRIGGGRLIKYIPYPVVTGYLSAVGLQLILSQLPKLLGLSKNLTLRQGLFTPAFWLWPGILVGLITMGVMFMAPKITRKLPAAILALTFGLSAYWICAIAIPSLGTLDANPFVVGAIGSLEPRSLAQSLWARWSGIQALDWSLIKIVVFPALTLGVLLSIDTLKTTVIVDAINRSRSDSNRELLAQGFGNTLSSILGGLAGAGTAGATLVNMSSGGRTRFSGFFCGLFSLGAALLLGRLVSWVPIATLAGILIAVGVRMIDYRCWRLLLQRSTALDFAVIAAVVLTSLLSNLIAAAGAGLALSIFLFVRDQIRGSVVRRRRTGDRVFSKKRRLPAEINCLEENGAHTAILELQGSLFFGTADQLLSELDADLKRCHHIVFDLRRVQSIDFTAAHMLEQIVAQAAERGTQIVFADLPAVAPTGQHLHSYLHEVGLIQQRENVQIFHDLDEALVWIEDQILRQAGFKSSDENGPLDLSQIGIFSGLAESVLNALKTCAQERSYSPREKVFSKGDEGDELFFIRKGTVRIELPLGHEKRHHLATFSRGDFFGDMSFLDQAHRSADAVAETHTQVYTISRKNYDTLCHDHPELSAFIFERLSFALAMRLRQTDAELSALKEA